MKLHQQLQQAQANAHAYYLQLHQVHWLIQGFEFMPLHKMTEEEYERMSSLYDDLAERQLQKGHMPLLSATELMQAATLVPLDAKVFDRKSVVVFLMEYHRYWLATFRDIAQVAADKGDSVTQAFAEEQLPHWEKSQWMLKAMAGEAQYD